MQFASHISIGAIGTDEAGNGNGGTISKQAGNLSNTTNVLSPMRLGEAQIAVQAKANIITVKSIGSKASLKQVLLKSGGNG